MGPITKLLKFPKVLSVVLVGAVAALVATIMSDQSRVDTAKELFLGKEVGADAPGYPPPPGDSGGDLFGDGDGGYGDGDGGYGDDGDGDGDGDGDDDSGTL